MLRIRSRANTWRMLALNYRSVPDEPDLPRLGKGAFRVASKREKDTEGAGLPFIRWAIYLEISGTLAR